MMAWHETPQLVERFAAVRECLHEACPHWTLGSSYDGWVQAQHREAERLISAVMRKLREHMQTFPAAHRRVGRWEVFAVDGSDAACPRTIRNQQALGDTGKPNGIPQLSMTAVHHVGLAMPWAFRVVPNNSGPSTESEREHLRDMLDELPTGSLLVADAGFIGHGLCREMLGENQHFLLRVGGNVHCSRTWATTMKSTARRLICGPSNSNRVASRRSSCGSSWLPTKASNRFIWSPAYTMQSD
jgi:hypothetical protein